VLFVQLTPRPALFAGSLTIQSGTSGGPAEPRTDAGKGVIFL